MTGKSIKKDSIGSNVIILTIAKIFFMCITMLSAMLLARFRTLDEYGTYSQLLLVINLVTTIFMLGLPNSVSYFLARCNETENRKRFLSVYFSLSTILCAIIGCVLLLLLPLIIAYFDNERIAQFAYFLLLYPWTSVISSNLENILVVYQKTKFLVVYRMLYGICMLGVIGVIELLQLGFSEYMICYLVMNCIFAIAVYVISGHLCGGLKVCLDKQIMKNIFVFSIPLGVASVVGTLNIEVDKLLVGWLMDTEQLAIYTNASKELPFTIIATSITAVLLPRITAMLKKNNNVQAVRLWNVATELTFVFMSIIVAGIFTYAEEAMTILYSEKYLPGVGVFRVYTLVLLLRVTYFGMILNAKGKTKKILISSVVALVLNAVLNPLFYYVFGMLGPAIATFLSVLIVLILQLKWTSKEMDISFKNVFPWIKCGEVLVINIFLAVLFKIVKQCLVFDIYLSAVGESLILGCIWVLMYFCALIKRVKRLWTELNSPVEELAE